MGGVWVGGQQRVTQKMRVLGQGNGEGEHGSDNLWRKGGGHTNGNGDMWGGSTYGADMGLSQRGHKGTTKWGWGTTEGGRGDVTHPTCAAGGGGGGSPSPERQQQGTGTPPIAPPTPNAAGRGGRGGSRSRKVRCSRSPGDSAGGPQPPRLTVSGDIPPIHPYLGGVLTAVILGGGGGVIRSATLGVCPPPFCH